VLTGEKPERKISWSMSIKQTGGTILAGVLNAYSRMWDPRSTARGDETFCHGIMDE